MIWPPKAEPLPAECKHLWEIHDYLIGLCAHVPDEQQTKKFKRVQSTHESYTETLSLLLQKTLEDEAQGKSWSKRIWANWLKKLQSVEDNYEQSIVDLCQWIEVHNDVVAKGLLQRKEEIFTELTSEPPKDSSETQDPPVEQRAEKQTQKDDDNESYGTVCSRTQTPVRDPDIEREESGSPAPNPDQGCEHERELESECDHDPGGEHGVEEGRDLMLEVGSLLGSSALRNERYDESRVHTCARSLKVLHCPEGLARTSSPLRRVDSDPGLDTMMERVVGLCEHAMEIKTEVANETAQHYESCI